MTEKTYRQAINDWRGERDANIRKDNNWLSLAGLFWLKLGRNQFGSDPASEVQLPARDLLSTAASISELPRGHSSSAGCMKFDA